AILGVQAQNVADVITEIPAGRTPQRWRETYEALSGLTQEVGGLAALASLPVLLTDGRVVSGARGAFLVSDDLPQEILQRLSEWGFRIIASEAGHHLLESLGATNITAGQFLDEAQTRQMLQMLRDQQDLG